MTPGLDRDQSRRAAAEFNKEYLDSSVKGDFQSVEVRSWGLVLCGMFVARDEGLPFVA